MTWIPRTKLQPPEPGPDILDRPALRQRLRQDVTSHRLTLISAPAGAGKTTMMAALGAFHPDLPVAWITLDEGDNELESLFNLLTIATGRLLPGCTRNAAALATTPPAEGAAESRRLMGMLINDILDCDPAPFVLALDDVHAIADPACLAALDYLLAHLPPMMHLVATTRHDPPLALSRLRARGQLAETRMDQLRFAPQEIAAWLNATLDLALSEHDLALVTKETGGWVTALRLLALTLRQRRGADRAQLLRQLHRSRHVIFDYLLDEVVHQLPPETRRFLLETSILESMTAALCRAVTGQEEAGRQLERLYRQNLFIERTDGPAVDETAAPAAYRYHALLRRALQRELGLTPPERRAALHLRAAAALGATPAAARHYLQAEAWPEAAGLLQLLVRQHVELGTMPAWLVTLIERLPAAVLAGHPWLRAAQGIYQLQRGHREQGRPLLQAAVSQLTAAGDELSRAYLLFNLSNVTVGTEMAAYLDQIGAVFAAREQEVPPRWQVSYHQAMVWKHLHAHQWPEVEGHLEQAVDAAVRSGEPGAFYTLASNNFTHFFYSRRATAAVLRLRDALAAKFPPGDLLARLGIINISLCQHWYQGEPDQAENLALQAQGMSRQYGIATWADVNAMLVLLYVPWLRDDMHRLSQALHEILAYIARVEAWRVAHNDMLCWLALVYWREGRGAAAAQFLPDMETDTVFARQRINTSLVRGLVAGAGGDLATAVTQLRDAIARQRAVGLTTTVDARLLLAVLYWQAGQRDLALRELDIGLGTWQRRRLPGVVLQTGRAVVPLLEEAVVQGIQADFAERCLAAFGLDVRPRSLTIETTGETLTPREAEVLGLIMRGQTNPQIAETLVISKATVKSHVTKILAKLGVSRRTEAAVLARELGLQ